MGKLSAHQRAATLVAGWLFLRQTVHFELMSDFAKCMTRNAIAVTNIGTHRLEQDLGIGVIVRQTLPILSPNKQKDSSSNNEITVHDNLRISVSETAVGSFIPS